MKEIFSSTEAIPGKDYWLCSKMIYDNGKRSTSKSIAGFRDHEDGTHPYFGNRIWAYDGNNQAFEKYRIYGPIPEPFINSDLTEQSSDFEKVFGNSEELDDMLAIIRNKFSDKILKHVPEASVASSPECVLYAIYKELEIDN